MPTKIREDAREVAKAALARGHTVSAAAAQAGISRQTLHDWMRHDDSLRQASDLGISQIEAVVLRDCLKNSDLALKVLGKRRPKAWGNKDRTEHRGSITHATLQLEAADRVLLLRAALAEAAQEEGDGNE